jgi:hypothetical protein
LLDDLEEGSSVFCCFATPSCEAAGGRGERAELWGFDAAVDGVCERWIIRDDDEVVVCYFIVESGERAEALDGHE